MTVFVQFESSEERIIMSTFSCEQDPQAWEFLGSVDDNDERLLAYCERNGTDHDSYRTR